MWLGHLDPDWEFAKFHGEANKIGKMSTINDGEGASGIMCKCCHNIIGKQPIEICSNTKQLEHLGFGIPLFYTFFRSCIILLFLSVCCYHIVSLYWAITYNNSHACEHDPRQNRLLVEVGQPLCWTFMVRFARLQKKVEVEEQIMRVTDWAVQFFFLVYTRNKILKRGEYYDEKTTTLSDFSILIKHLQPQEHIQAKLKLFFHTFFSKPYQIQQITLLPPDLYHKQLKKESKKLRNQLRKFYKSEQFGQQFEQLSKQLEEINQKIKRNALQDFKKSEADELQTEKAIIVLKKEKNKMEILNSFPQLKKQKKKQLFEIFGEKSSKIVMEEAPEPYQIYWKPISQAKKKRKIRTFISWFLSAAILAAMTVAIYFILHAKTNLLVQSLQMPSSQKQISDSKIYGAIALVFITILFILFFNKLVMSFIFHKLTDLQQLETGFKFQTSFGIKYCLGLFFTTAVMTLIVQGIQSRNFATYLYGLIDEETLMFFAATTFVPLFWLINPFHLYKLAKRKILFGSRHLTQKEANILMEGSPYEVGKRYAQIVEIVWFTYLYATLIPFGAILALMGLIFLYWVDKYNLLRRSVLHYHIGYGVNRAFLTMLEVTLIMAPAGALIFDGALRQLEALNLIPSIIMIVLSFIYILLPKEKLIECFYQQNFNLQPKEYGQVKSDFVWNYHTKHPILMIVNQNKYREKYRSKGFNLTAEKDEIKRTERHLIEYQ